MLKLSELFNGGIIPYNDFYVTKLRLILINKKKFESPEQFLKMNCVDLLNKFNIEVDCSFFEIYTPIENRRAFSSYRALKANMELDIEIMFAYKHKFGENE